MGCRLPPFPAECGWIYRFLTQALMMIINPLRSLQYINQLVYPLRYT